MVNQFSPEFENTHIFIRTDVLANNLCTRHFTHSGEDFAKRMKTLVLLKQMRECGFMFALRRDGKLLLESPDNAESRALRQRAKHLRTELLAILEEIQERAAIVQYEGQLLKADAESAAFAEAFDAYRNMLGIGRPLPKLSANIQCPTCKEKKFEDFGIGWWCTTCENVVWLYVPDHSWVAIVSSQ